MPTANPVTQSSCRNEVWGTTSNTRVVALIADVARDADAYAAAMTCNLLLCAFPSEEREQRMRLLVHPLAHDRKQAERLLLGLGYRNVLCQEPKLEDPQSVLPHCDAALSFGPKAGGRLARWTVKCGVCVITNHAGAQRLAVDPAIGQENDRVVIADSDQPKHMAAAIAKRLWPSS